ncbi:MAG: DNA translocase FtsK [Planctomycetes bacterium]|nr:DNA translocase FtsK [Planctomycetota bacterium]
MAAARRGPRMDLLPWGLLLAGLLVAVAVFSHEPAAGGAAASNLLGPPGAWLAGCLFESLGCAVHALLAGWFVLVIMLLLPGRRLRWSARLAGWIMLLPASAVLADWIGPDYLGGPVTGSGGSVGAFLTYWLAEEFGKLGGALLWTVFTIAGCALALDVYLFRSLRVTQRFVGKASRIYARVAWALLKRFGRLAAVFLGISREASPPPIHRPLDTSAAADPPRMSHGIPINHADETIVEGPAPSDPRILPINRPTPSPTDQERFADFELPPLTLLEEPAPFPYDEHDQHLRETAILLEKTFKDFELNVHVVGINTGPVITQYEVALETGLRVNKVTTLADDLALNLKVSSVRIVAPIPGKNTVGIEVPNEHRATVRLKEVIQTSGRKLAKSKIPLFFGKDTEGRALVYDLAEMPHLLIAGRTGTGKSVCMNAIILSILMTRKPNEVRMIMIDPKMLELSEYGKIPHLMHPVVKDMKKAEAILAWAVDKMEERYDLLSRARVRSIASYNELTLEEIHSRVKPEPDEIDKIPDKMPYIVIFVDEMNDLMMTMKREVEGHIIRLAQKSRAAGIHLVVATQKPTVDVITGLIKSNLPARICFQVSSRTDSRVVLDEIGADKLLGKGDMLFLVPNTSNILRAQGTYLSDEEITRVVTHLECEPCFAPELVQLKSSNETGSASAMEALRARDDMYESAIEVVVREGRGSVSLLQRALGIGYGRAARLIDFMAEDGIVGAYNGSSAREVLYTAEEWENLRHSGHKTARA